MAYSVIERHIWHDETFRRLSRDARLLFLYLLTSPHSNRLGMYVLDRLYAASDMQMEPAEVDAALLELQEAGRIDYDGSTRVVLIRRFLKHNPLKNQNVVKAACKDLVEVPFTKQLHEQLAEAVNRWGKAHYEQLREQLAEQLGDKTRNPDPIPYPEPLTTTEDKSSEAGASDSDNLGAVLAPLIRQHMWLGKEPPPKTLEARPDWHMGRELSIAGQLIDSGDVSVPTLARIIETHRDALDVPSDRPTSLLMFNVADRRDYLNICRGHVEKLGGPSKVGDVLRSLGVAS